MTDYLDELARFAAGTTFEDLSSDAVDAARDVTLDTFGAITAGMEEPENSRLASWAAENMLPAVSGIIATPYRASPMAAALVNSTAGVALEMDEGNRFGGGHPAIHVLPGLLAVAEQLGRQAKSSSPRLSSDTRSRPGSAARPCRVKTSTRTATGARREPPPRLPSLGDGPPRTSGA